ncbi:MAG TPA: DUF1116 domain-containing protein [Candidatus Dormibacteraeota bacterium]|nr:DUF1116 domain-containing protein [Candidatus Dormibacteraeota bacterium]
MADDSAGRIQLPEQVAVVNVGLGVFAEAVRAQGAAAVELDWRIPARGDPHLVAALTRLYGRLNSQVDAANKEVITRLDRASPRVVGISPARAVIPDLDARTVLHCGPPLAWEEFCGPLRRSVRATVMMEGWAQSPEEADTLVAGGQVRLDEANRHSTVVPMAATVGPSTSVFVVENSEGGNRSFSPINQGPGRVAWFGVDSPEAVRHLTWLRDCAGPVLKKALQAAGPLDLFSFIAQGLLMGDDVHMRSQATTNLFLRALLPHLVGLQEPRAVDVARFLSANHLFFLNLAMAAAKAATDWASPVPGSSVVTGMARNGTTFGIKVSGTGERWFTAPAPAVEDALYHPGFNQDVAAPDIGDSAVLELVGLGGAAAAASPAVANFLGGTMRAAVATTEAAESICAGRSSRLQLGFLDFRGSPIGVDVRRAVELSATPAINTGILHAAEPLGQIGAGIAHAPLDCFRQALLALDETLA